MDPAEVDAHALISKHSLRPGRTAPIIGGVMATRKQAYEQLVGALTDMMAVPPHKRKMPVVRPVAEKMVELRRLYESDGIPDWNGRSYEYKAAIASALREAGAPTEAEDNSLHALIRHHVSNVVREQAPLADMQALGRDPDSPTARKRRDTPRRPPKPSEPVKAPTIPNILLEALGDPVGLVTHAIRALQAARRLEPTESQVETLRILLDSLRDEVNKLAADLG